MFLIYFVSQPPSHCRVLLAVGKVLVSQALFGSLLLNLALFLALYYNWLNLSLSLSLIQAHSGSLWLTLALSGSPRLTLARSGSLSVFLRRSSAHNVLAGLVKSLPQIILSWYDVKQKGACKMLPFCFFLWLCSNKQFHRAVVRIGKQGRDWRTCKQAISPLTIPLGTSTCSANYNIH